MASFCATARRLGSTNPSAATDGRINTDRRFILTPGSGRVACSRAPLPQPDSGSDVYGEGNYRYARGVYVTTVSRVNADVITASAMIDGRPSNVRTKM